MGRFSAGVLTGAGSTTLPLISLYAAAGSGCALREWGVTNTTVTDLAVRLARLTTQGTPGTGLNEERHNPNGPVAACTAFATHTVAPTVGGDLGYRTHLAAAKGAGIIWTFGGDGLVILAGTANGVGLLIENGSGQPCQADMVWDE